jgi:hypothetical protein
MNPSNTPRARSAFGNTALIALGCVLSLAMAQFPAARAGDCSPALRSLDDKAPSLPLTANFSKVTDPDVGPYVLSLTNTSKDAIKVSVKIQLSVTSHDNAKERNIPNHVIDPGQAWTIDNLAATDKVTVTADGFAPLELIVP